MTTIRPAKHQCNLGSPIGRHGEIIACSGHDGCGKWWRAVEPGNPAYAKWVRAWFRQAVHRG